MVASIPVVGMRVPEFDIWRPGYSQATVTVLIGGTTTPAPLFSDPLLTISIVNPQTLASQTDANGATYGKWQQTVYTNCPHSLLINQTDQTAVEYPPIVSMTGQDISQAVVSSTRGAYPVDVNDAVDLQVFAAMCGSMAESDGSGVVTATLNKAIGVAAAQGGGEVLLPSGNVPYTTITLPQGVVLRGASEAATTMRSDNSGSTIILGGDGAGLRDLTVDGIDLVPNSIGVDMVNVAYPVFDRVTIKRFNLGLRAKGIPGATWNGLSLSNCSINADLRGDADAGVTNNGTTVEGISWRGGVVSLGATQGVIVECIDQPAQHIEFSSVQFEGNLGDAVKLIGARGVTFNNCVWTTNTTNFTLQDGTNSAQVAINTSQRIRVNGGRFSTGTLNFNGLCLDVAFDAVAFQNVSINLTVPTTPIILNDCITDAATTITGDLTKLLRFSSNNDALVSGITTDGNAITAWQTILPPGESILLEVRAIARRRDGTDWGNFHIEAGANQPGASLPYTTVTTAFTPGAILTGQTSGASARVTANSSSGGSGTLTIRDINGTFQVGELIVDTTNGSARMSGSLSYSNSALDGGGVTVIRAAQTSNSGAYAVTIDVQGQAVRARVQGAASNVVEWTVKVLIVEP